MGGDRARQISESRVSGCHGYVRRIPCVGPTTAAGSADVSALRWERGTQSGLGSGRLRQSWLAGWDSFVVRPAFPSDGDGRG